MSVLVCSLDLSPVPLQGGGKTMACPSGKGHGKKGCIVNLKKATRALHFPLRVNPANCVFIPSSVRDGSTLLGVTGVQIFQLEMRPVRTQEDYC